MPKSVLHSFLLALLFLFLDAQGGHTADPPGDHFLCYRAVKQLPFAATSRMLEDQLGGPDPFDVTRVTSICNPVDKNGEGVTYPQVHQEGYLIKRPAGSPKFVREDRVTRDQFAQRTLTLLRPESLLDVTPKALGTTPPAPFPSDPTSDPAVNRFKCYKARLARGSTRFIEPPPPVLTDQFYTGGQPFHVGKPTKLCMPVDKQGETPGAELRPTHLVCYKVKLPPGTRFAARDVATNSSNFGPHVLRAVKPTELCVPALKDPPPLSISLASGSTGLLLSRHAGSPRGVGCGSIVPGPAPMRLLGNPSSMLACDGLNLGGGTSIVPEVPVADGAYSRFDIGACTAGVCSIAGTPPGGLNLGEQCSQAGCAFGVPQPISNGAASTCIHATLATDASGTINLNNGSLDLTLDATWAIYFTGSAIEPCPLCSASGTPANPGIGSCSGGANVGAACVSTNSLGLSNDCPPISSNASCTGAQVPDPCCTGAGTGTCASVSINVDLAPLGTGLSSMSDPAGGHCPGQSIAATEGCFGASGASCSSVTEMGAPGGPIAVGSSTSVDLGSVFCLPSSGNVLADAIFGLPGPGALRSSYTITAN